MHFSLKAVAVLGGAIIAAALPATGVARPAATHSGKVNFASADINDKAPHDVVTGAITDYGTDKAAGKNFEKVVLSKGTFEVDSTKLNKSFKFSINPTTCAATGSGAASGAAISHGTGAYAGISGSLSLHASITAIAKRVNGKCSEKAAPLAEVDQFSGTGHVSY